MSSTISRPKSRITYISSRARWRYHWGWWPVGKSQYHLMQEQDCRPTFSCRRCFRSLSSRYVRFDSTGVLNGFIIFFTATGWPFNWSLAELFVVSQYPSCSFRGHATTERVYIPDQAKCTHSYRLEIGVSIEILVCLILSKAVVVK